MPHLKQIFTLCIDLSSLQEILSLKKDYERYHPLILSCQLLDAKTSKYLISEKPFPWLPIKINYRAEVNFTESKITYVLSRIPLHVVHIAYLLEEMEEGTIDVECTIGVSGPPIVAHYLIAKIGRAQKQMFLNLNASP